MPKRERRDEAPVTELEPFHGGRERAASGWLSVIKLSLSSSSGRIVMFNIVYWKREVLSRGLGVYKTEIHVPVRGHIATTHIRVLFTTTT